MGDAAIGGPFNLVTHNGVPVSDINFRGKYMLIYFGFTYCPGMRQQLPLSAHKHHQHHHHHHSSSIIHYHPSDICPTELKKMAAVLDKLEQQGLSDKIVPLFITIDPWRDTVDQIRGKYIGVCNDTLSFVIHAYAR